MELQQKNYVPILCYVDDNWMDIGGNVYPEDGVVTAKEFTNDINIECGLYGIFWGKTEKLFYEKLSGNWIVVKVEVDNNFIVVDSLSNTVKFNNGMIICSGNAYEMGSYLWDNINNVSQYSCYINGFVKESDIVGTVKWVKRCEKVNKCYS